MRDLLKRWSELEPERCDYQANEIFALRMKSSIWCVAAKNIEQADHSMIQGAVQEAIDGRGWVVGLTGYAGRYLGTCSDATADRKGRHEHESAAAALLSAYMEVLEAKS